MELTLEQMKANRKLWVEALRSGKYEQTRTMLKSEHDAYCCLGVLSVIARCKFVKAPDGGYQTPDSKGGYAGTKAMDFVGLRTDYGSFSGGSLTSKNDSGASFETIADIIECEPHGLFVESVAS